MLCHAHQLIVFLRCLDDVDDEVRDRAALYLKSLNSAPLANVYVKDGESWLFLAISPPLTLSSESTFSLAALESKLVTYLNDSQEQAQPFDVSDIPKISREQAAKEVSRESTILTRNCGL